MKRAPAGKAKASKVRGPRKEGIVEWQWQNAPTKPLNCSRKARKEEGGLRVYQGYWFAPTKFLNCSRKVRKFGEEVVRGVSTRVTGLFLPLGSLVWCTVWTAQ